ncbi:MAG: hypothetical protein ACXVK3_13490, partial [Candidatus Angelobacter sp.]
MTVPIRLALTAAFFLAAVPNSSALFQAPPTDTLSAYIVEDLRELVETPAVSGYEQAVGKKIVGQLKGFTQ